MNTPQTTLPIYPLDNAMFSISEDFSIFPTKESSTFSYPENIYIRKSVLGEENLISLQKKNLLKYAFISLIRTLMIQGKITISDQNALSNLIEELWENELEVFHKFLESISSKLSKFHISIYDSDSELPKVYICPIFEKDYDIELIMQELQNLNEEKIKTDPNNLLWFIGFSYEYKQI